jgi:hypothetical protein
LEQQSTPRSIGAILLLAGVDTTFVSVEAPFRMRKLNVRFKFIGILFLGHNFTVTIEPY